MTHRRLIGRHGRQPRVPCAGSSPARRFRHMEHTTTQPLTVQTTPLMANCLRSVQLRREGKIIGGTGEALFKGVLGHEMLQRRLLGTGIPTSDLVAWTIQKQRDENMPCSASVIENATKYAAEVELVVEQYMKRVAPSIATLIGCELPIRCTINIDGEQVEFQSHIDVLYRDTEGWLTIADFKFRDESATRPYLERNMQLGMYWYAARHGSIRIEESMDLWVQYVEPVRCVLVDMWGFKPYSRKTAYIDDNGEPQEGAKGDTRPLHTIVKHCNFQDAAEGWLIEELTTRVRMMRANLWPMNPSPQGCMTCQSRPHCKPFGWEEQQ